MNILLFIKQAISSIKANKLRSFLSALWIIIWILSFVIMLSFWEWTQKQLREDLWSESNIINVYKWRSFMPGWPDWKDENFWPKKESADVFTEEILNEIIQKVPKAYKAILEYSRFWTPTVYKTKQVHFSYAPVTKKYFLDNEAKIILWSYFWDDDFEKKNKVIIIWYKLVKSTFWDENPIWQKISIWWEIFYVSGVLDEKWWEFDNIAFMPNTTAKKYFWKTEADSIKVYAKLDDEIDQLKKDLNYFLFKKSKVDNYSDVNYNISTNKDWIKRIEEFNKQFSYFLIWIWAISLIVWWIWIMNITLVSVTERTREIWIRKAIWASNFSILLQFLIEAIILTLIWSLIAIWLSYWIARVINTYKPFWEWFLAVINTNVLFIAIIVSISMWIIFGIMPAYKAARLKPIDALHFE